MATPNTKRQVYIHNFSFNQDGSCFIAATTDGFRVYTSSPLSEFARREYSLQEKWPFRNVRIAKMLYRSSCFALVTGKEPRKVQMWDDKKMEIVSVIWSRQPVLNVLLGRDIICIVGETVIYIYQAGAVTPLTVIVTGVNPKGLCALSEGSPLWHLTCPTTTPGVVRVQTAACPDANAGLLITAHKSALSALAISSNGALIATASEIGTLIRLFRSHDGTQLQEFRLGNIPHHVHNITFRGDRQFLLASSNSKTVHIFKIKDDGSTRQSSTTNNHVTAENLSTSPSNISINQPQKSLMSFRSNFVPTSLRSSNNSFSLDCHGMRKSARDWMQTAIKNALSLYSDLERSFAEFHLPTNNFYKDLDVRVRKSLSAPSSDQHSDINETESVEFPLQNSTDYSVSNKNQFINFLGPVCAFSGYQSNHFYVIHHDGFFYEARFNAQNGNECDLLSLTLWFAPRRDFVVEATLDTVHPLRDIYEEFGEIEKLSTETSEEKISTAIINRKPSDSDDCTSRSEDSKNSSVPLNEKSNSGENLWSFC